MALGSSESTAHSILFEMNSDTNIVAHLHIGPKVIEQQNLSGFVELFSIVSMDEVRSHAIFVKKFWRTSQFHEFFKKFQLCTHARITKFGSHEK